MHTHTVVFHMHTSTHTRTHAHACTHARAHTHTHTQTHKHTQTNTHTHTTHNQILLKTIKMCTSVHMMQRTDMMRTTSAHLNKRALACYDAYPRKNRRIFGQRTREKKHVEFCMMSHSTKVPEKSVQNAHRFMYILCVHACIIARILWVTDMHRGNRCNDISGMQCLRAVSHFSVCVFHYMSRHTRALGASALNPPCQPSTVCPFKAERSRDE